MYSQREGDGHWSFLGAEIPFCVCVLFADEAQKDGCHCGHRELTEVEVSTPYMLSEVFKLYQLFLFLLRRLGEN